MAYKDSSGFYVYVHRRATDGRVFYVGKGKGKRAWNLKGRSKYWGSIVAKHGYTVEIVQDSMQEWQAFEMERELIALYGRDSLCNMTDGGEGSSGAKRSPETLILMSKNNAMRNPEHRKKISIANKGKKRPDMTAYPLHHRPGVKEKVSGANNGKARAVVCLDNNMSFDTATAASLWLRSIGFPKAANGDIIKCCKGKLKTSHKHKFAYA